MFLISLKAGGFGLNLSEAGYCFVLDPWWNPATEAQAVDRAHRIGQTKSVMVYRMVAKDTIEEKVMALKTAKQELFGSIFDDEALSRSGVDRRRDPAAGGRLSPAACPFNRVPFLTWPEADKRGVWPRHSLGPGLIS